MSECPIEDQYDELFRGARVRVVTRSRTYEGWARECGDDRTILLSDVQTDDGETFGSALITDHIAVERIGANCTIRRIPTDDIDPSPYNARTYDSTAHRQLVRETRLRGHLLTYPAVREVDGGEFEIVSGHRRIEAARRAGLDTVPAQILSIDDWQATRRFVAEHVPLPGERADRDEEFYTDNEIAQSVAKLRERWSNEKLRELPALEPELDCESGPAGSGCP